MVFTFADYRSLVQMLYEHPEWREELRPLVLSEELLKLPETQARTEATLDRMAARLDSLETTTSQRFDAVDERFDAVDEWFNAVDKRLDGVDERIDTVDRRLTRVENPARTNGWQDAGIQLSHQRRRSLRQMVTAADGNQPIRPLRCGDGARQR